MEPGLIETFVPNTSTPIMYIFLRMLLHKITPRNQKSLLCCCEKSQGFLSDADRMILRTTIDI